MKSVICKNIIQSPFLDKTKIQGSPKELMDNFFNKRIFSRKAQEVIYREAEDAFRNKLDDENGITGVWQGEFWGKWMISAVRVCEYSGDAKLKEFIRQAVANMLKLQEPDGYLGTYRDRLNVFATSPVERAKLPENMRWCRWNWNIWCRKYTLWGLLEAYRLLNEPEILAAAEKFICQLIDMLHENHIRIADTGMFYGLPSCSIMKPVLMLYEETGNRKYLEFALEIAACWEEKNGRLPNLIANASCPLPLHEWYFEGRQWTKAYELLSCLDGLLELYRHTGEQKYFDTVKNLYERIKQFDLNHMFSVGFNDQLSGAADCISVPTEPCDVIHWMRLSLELFKLSGESVYMDDFELAYCNAFLASVNRSGEWGARVVRTHGRHFHVEKQAGMKYHHCCVNNMPRGFMDAAAASVMHNDTAIFVNMYMPFEAQLPQGKIEISGNYPLHCKACVKVSLSRPTTLYLRIPAWSAKTLIRCAGQTFQPQSGAYFEINVSGKVQLELEFDQKVSIRELEYKQAAPEAEVWFRDRFISNESVSDGGDMVAIIEKNVCTLQYGPLLLARSKYIGNSEEEMFATESIYGKDASCELEPTEHPEARFAFNATISANGKIFTTPVCDYASAANEIIADPRFFSIFF
jgi:DUF1680 family protein